MSEYTAVKGLGDTITCDECNDIAEDWFTGESRAICQDCYSQMPISMSELADLTHATQVERFGWCSCEEQEQFPYADCPKECDVCEAKVGELHCNCGNCDCVKESQQLPTQINVLRAVSYDVSGIIEGIKENEPDAQITIESILDYIEDWVWADFGGVTKGLIYQDENGGEL